MNVNLNIVKNLGWKSDESAAFLSLRTALYAYFETYKATYEGRVNPIEFEKLVLQFEFESDLYKSLYFTIITHFQNFFELIFKDVLMKINPLFILKWNKSVTSFFYREINHEKNVFNENNQSIEFSEMIERLLNIRKTHEKDEIINIIKPLLDKKDDLIVLNNLRNRIWHGGVFYLSYYNLDLFICQNILPLVKYVVNLDWYSQNVLWKPKNLNNHINPIESLITEAALKKPDIEKMALLKELGRASYHNPVIQIEDNCSPLERAFYVNLNYEKMKFVEAKTNAVRNVFLSDVFNCPVCRQKTLVKYELDDDSYDGEQCRYERHCIPNRIKCETCSFEIRPNIVNLSLCDIDDQNIWNDHD